MNLKRIPFWLLALLILILVGKSFLERRTLEISSRRPALDANDAFHFSQGAKSFSFGFDQWVAGLLWIGLIQRASTEPVPQGMRSWEYSQLRSITQLDRNFDCAFSFGASYLSVFRQDKQGARDLLERWTQVKPRSWRTHYLLGYHLYSEMNNFPEGAKNILKAASLEGAPPWLTSLGIRLLSESGALSHSLALAAQLYPALAEGVGRDRLQRRIRSLKYQLEKISLESKLAQFQERFRRTPHSLDELLQSFPTQGRTPASPLETEVQDPSLMRLLAEPVEFRYDSTSKKIRPRNPDFEKDLESLGIYHPKS